MKNKGFIAAIIILVLLILLLLFWHPLDSQKTTATTEAKADSTTVTDTPDKPQDTTNGKSKQQKPPKQQPPKGSPGSTTKVIIIVKDATTGKNIPLKKGEAEFNVRENVREGENDITVDNSGDNRKGFLDGQKYVEVIFRLNSDDGNHWPQLLYDELNDDESFKAEVPEAVWNNTGDGHNLRFFSPTSDIEGNQGVTTDGTIFLKASQIQKYLHNGVVEVKGSSTHWAFKKMTLENGYYILEKK